MYAPRECCSANLPVSFIESLRDMGTPLHPAIVHFPIVLTMIAGLFSFVSCFRPTRALLLITCSLWVVAAAATVGGVWSGEREEHRVEETRLTESQEALLEEHEEAGEFARIVLLVTALVSVGGIVLVKRGSQGLPITLLRYLLPLLGVAAIAAVVRTGHLGGRLVYEEGVGILKQPNGELE